MSTSAVSCCPALSVALNFMEYAPLRLDMQIFGMYKNLNKETRLIIKAKRYDLIGT